MVDKTRPPWEALVEEVGHGMGDPTVVRYTGKGDSHHDNIRLSWVQRIAEEMGLELRWVSADATVEVPWQPANGHNPSANPGLAYPGDVGIDLPLATEAVCAPGEITDVPLGLRIKLPPGAWGLIIGRSSTERKLGVRAVTGVIDNGYTGPLFAGLTPIGNEPITLPAGTRAVQLLLLPMLDVLPIFHEVDELPATERGSNGFGSSGV